ncbi:MAG: single-stranded DNA-binding protein [Clostridiales bacterium]|nr:single-stranded DNA-binding protein [Clostridiales bacterium]
MANNENRAFKNPWNNVMTNGHLWNGELKTTQNGRSVFTGKLNIYDGKDASGNNKYQKISVKAFGKDADALSKEKEGTEVNIEGKIQTDTYEKNGEKRYFTYILIRNYAEEEQTQTDDGLPF